MIGSKRRYIGFNFGLYAANPVIFTPGITTKIADIRVINAINENIKVSKKTTFFQKLFGKNTKADKKIEESKVNFFDEIREISEENNSQKTDILNDRSSPPPLSDNNLSQLNDSQSNIVEEDKEVEINSDKNANEINDDLLQIPAFLRRQAN